MSKKIKTLGIVSIVMGIIAGLLCITPRGLFFAIPLGFIGMICSGIYVYIDTKNELNKKNITPGIIGMALNSLPVLFILSFLIINHLRK
jgi:uncharacterized membrane protein YeaQ/YmgE (transglycosylase-associated protein family)